MLDIGQLADETLIPLSTFRWLRYKDEPFNVSWPCGRLQQAYRKPGADILIWRNVPELVEDRDSSSTSETKP